LNLILCQRSIHLLNKLSSSQIYLKSSPSLSGSDSVHLTTPQPPLWNELSATPATLLRGIYNENGYDMININYIQVLKLFNGCFILPYINLILKL
jgi:hypothetical protein